jgi:predicted ATP-grasp superfamily ATP-dependent carboligase
LLIPVTDGSAEAILSHQHLLPATTRLPFASLPTYRAASDKVHVHQLARDAGIGIEDAVIVERPGDAAPVDPRLYPGYVKPHRSVVGDRTRRKLTVRAVADAAACARVLADLPPEAFPVLVQGKVEGPGEGVFVARWNGRTLARFAHRRLREKPPAGGVSVYRESIALDPVLLAACERVLDALGWNGVAMIEGKRDAHTGAWRVMEINGRFWGSLQLAVDAGVDFPALLARAVLGETPGEPPSWETGGRLRWEWGDVDH